MNRTGNGMRIVYELKRDAITNVVLNKLYQMTPLQTSFNVNNIALVKGQADDAEPERPDRSLCGAPP